MLMLKLKTISLFMRFVKYLKFLKYIKFNFNEYLNIIAEHDDNSEMGDRISTQQSYIPPMVNVSDDALGLDVLLNSRNNTSNRDDASEDKETLLIHQKMKTILKTKMMMKMKTVVCYHNKIIISIETHHPLHFNLCFKMKKVQQRLRMKKRNFCINLIGWRRKVLKFQKSSVWNQNLKI